MSKQVMAALPIQASIYWLGFSKWLLPFFFFSVPSLPPSFLPFLSFSFSFQFGSLPERNNFIVTSYRECYHYVEPWNPSTNTKTKLTFLLQTEKEWLDRQMENTLRNDQERVVNMIRMNTELVLSFLPHRRQVTYPSLPPVPCFRWTLGVGGPSPMESLPILQAQLCRSRFSESLGIPPTHQVETFLWCVTLGAHFWCCTKLEIVLYVPLPLPSPFSILKFREVEAQRTAIAHPRI